MPDKKSEGSFDEAAAKAREEFAKLLGALCEEEANGGKKILDWQKKWYLQAGHKRLGKILVEFAKSYKLYKFGFLHSTSKCNTCISHGFKWREVF